VVLAFTVAPAAITCLDRICMAHADDTASIKGELELCDKQMSPVYSAFTLAYADIYSTGVVFYEMLARELPGPDRVPPSRDPSTDRGSTSSSSAPWSATATAATGRRG
jgi:serine/threonine protein kinase